MKSNGCIYLIPTPISDTTNLEEINPKTLQYIVESDILFAENLRTSRRFISKLKKHLNSRDPVIEELDIRELDKRTKAEQLYNWCVELFPRKDSKYSIRSWLPGDS